MSERNAAWRTRRTARGQPQRTAARKQAEKEKRTAVLAARCFVGCDGEGAGTDEGGRQLYQLFRMGDRELFTGSRLSTGELLDFITAGVDRDAIFVGFAFGYDVTQILRDLSPAQLKRLFSNNRGPRQSPYTWVFYEGRGFGVEYLPRNYLRVCRLRATMRTGSPQSSTLRGAPTKDRQSYMTWETVPDSAVTIYDTFSFFQCKFVKALTDWGIGSEEQRERIQREKDRRAEFGTISNREREYCEEECQLLAQMMVAFRDACYGAGIRPKTWNGAGKIAAALHEAHETMTRRELEELRHITKGLLDAANKAYYGGRFEVTRVGHILGSIYEYDIRSAYPAAMGKLPCLRCCRWRKLTAGQMEEAVQADPAALYVSKVHFTHAVQGSHGSSTSVGAAPSDRRPNLYGLPVRKKDGRLFWPRSAQGVYWSVEINAAKLLGCQVKYGPGYLYERRCDHQPFDWLEPLYEYRQSIGAAQKGLPIKLGINALYGKLVQRIGTPRWGNPIWGGLITAHTRALLIEAAAADPDAVLMLATDALFSLRPLPLPQGKKLGQWDAEEHEELFIVQPGIYWGAAKPKTRGIDRTVLGENRERFERHWLEYAERSRAALSHGPVLPPSVAVKINLFTGLRLAHARGKPETAGVWVRCICGDHADADHPHADCKAHRKIRFDWTAKRGRGTWETAERVWTYPPAGDPDLISQPHAGDPVTIADMDLAKFELEEQPDHIDLTPDMG